MSHQPFPGQPGPPPQPPYGVPSGPSPYVQQPAMPFTPAPDRGARRKGLIGLGIALLLLGVLGGGAMFLIGGSQYIDAVKDLARAPVGCTTTLDFDRTGTFVIYVETKGEVGNLRGDCSNADATYERDEDDLPEVDLSLVDEDGDELDIDDDDSRTYDADGFVGRSLGTVEVDDAGSYELSVQSDEEDFAITVGKDPEGAGKLAVAGLIVGLLGVVLGLIFLVLGLRRRTPAPPRGGDPTATATGTYPAQPFAPAPSYAPPPVAPGAYPAPPPPYAPPSYGGAPTAPLPTTPPPAPPSSWSPPPPS